jgi:hypothetical protein
MVEPVWYFFFTVLTSKLDLAAFAVNVACNQAISSVVSESDEFACQRFDSLRAYIENQWP